MKSALLAQILLVGSLLLLSVPSNIFHVAAAPSYLPGVKQGDTTTYGNVTGTWHGNVSAAITLNGAGSSAVSPLINALSTTYSQLDPNVQISYQPVGSGAGINDLIAKTTDFSASDLPLTNAQRAAAPNSLTIPDTVGAVALVYNVAGIPTGLRLNATVIAEIFLGTITMWNDAAIAQLNPSVALPSQAIVTVHRADASGTTFVFTGYLNTAAAGVWTLGQGTTVAWPVGLGAAGNQGVVGIVQGTSNTIGYVELNSALSNNMKLSYLRNAAGNFVQPMVASVAASLSNSSVVLPQGNASWASVSLLNQPGTNSYPIVSFSYTLVYQELNVVPGMSSDKARALVNFLWYAVHAGQQRGVPLSYVPLPLFAVAVDETTIRSMTFNGFSLLGSSTPTATIAVQPNSIVDINRSMKQITIDLALNSTPDVPPINGISVMLSYDYPLLRAASLNFSTNVFTQTGLSTIVTRDCLDGIGSSPNTCAADDGPGVTSFEEFVLGGLTSDGTHGNIFSITFNVDTASPAFSQIRVDRGLLFNGTSISPPAPRLLDGYYTSQTCEGKPCGPGDAKFTWSPQPVKQRQFAIFDASASSPSPGSVITDYLWSFHDPFAVNSFFDSKTNSTSAWIYQASGNYPVTLTITDSNGIKSASTVSVSVVKIPPPPPAGAPPFIAEFLNVQSIQVLVQNIIGNSINASQTFTFNNGTAPRTFLLSGNVLTGAGNLGFWILSGGLTTGSTIYSVVNSPAINYTDTESFAGAPRQVVHLNILASGGAVHLNWAWDQATGVLVSFFANAFFQNGTNPAFGNATVQMTSTNLWSPVSFSISVNPGQLTFSVNNTSPPTSQILLASHNLVGPIQLSATTSPLSGLNVIIDSSTVDLTLNGQNTTTLRPVVSTSTIPGVYTVNIVARAGILSQITSVIITVLPAGDFAIQANPSDITIQKSGGPSPFPVGTATITLTSLRGFAGDVMIHVDSLSPLGFGPFPSDVHLFSSGANFTLTIDATNALPGTYLVTVTGTSLTLTHSVDLTVQVTTSPPDFQIYLQVPIGGNQLFAGSSTIVGVQAFGSGPTPYTGMVSLSGQVAPLFNNGPALSFNPTSVNLQFGFGNSQMTISTTALTPPGNYSITVTAVGGSVSHTAQFQITILPLPVITVSPSSGPIGTQVTVHGTGFQPPSQGPFFFTIEIQVTFDDQLIGLFFVQSNSFNFTFNIPVSQPGMMHLIHAKELYPSSLDVQTSFFVEPQPLTLSVTMATGTIYFPGDTATIFVKTSFNGQLTPVTSLQVTLIQPNGTSLSLNAVAVSGGFYKTTFTVPSKGSLGTYAVVVKAHQTGSVDASALSSFEVKPTWLQANRQNIATTTGIVGAAGTLGVITLAWRKGYLTRKNEELT